MQRRLLLAALLALLAGCGSPPAPAPAALPDLDWYRHTQEQVVPVDPIHSSIAIVVRRAGVLSRLGHDHVISVHSLQGFCAPHAQRADLLFRLDQMSVDDEAPRRAHGLGAPPPQDAIEGTRHNMLVKVLEADRYPVAGLHVTREGARIRLTVTLHGVTRTVDLPGQVQERPGWITAGGTLTLRQSDFGITPLSLLGGALAVQDEMILDYHMVFISAPRSGAIQD